MVHNAQNCKNTFVSSILCVQYVFSFDLSEWQFKTSCFCIKQWINIFDLLISLQESMN